jgi:hypothetical protein
MTPENALVSEGQIVVTKTPYLGVPKVRREVITPLPKLERYELVHLEMSFRGGAVVLVESAATDLVHHKSKGEKRSP